MKWESTYRKAATGEWMLAAFMLVKILLQYVLIHPSYDLHRDEYLHLDQSQHLAWGFISVPPLTSWIAWIIRALGNDSFWVKFFPTLFGAFTIFFAWKIVSALGGKLFAKLIVSLAILFSGILRLNILFQPNSFEVLSWTAFYYYLILYVQHKNPRTLYVLAVVLALSFLNKYNIIFLVAGLLPAMLTFADRSLLRSKHVLFAALLFMLMISPNILWQINNGIPFVKHMKELADTQLVNMSRVVFLKEQLLFFINSFFVLVIAAVGFIRFRAFRPYRFLFIGYLITILVYIWLRAKGYYSVGLYPVLLAFGAVYLEYLTERKIFLRIASAVVIILIFLPVFRLAFPYAPAEVLADRREVYRDLGLLRWEDGKDHQLPQDFADMLGWRELAYKTDSAFGLLKEKDQVLVLTDNYGQAGAVNYYTINRLHAVSFNADYLNWFPVQKQIRHVIRIMEIDEDDDDPLRTQEKSLCDTLILAGQVESKLAREYGTRIWVMKNVKASVWPVIRSEMEAHKK